MIAATRMQDQLERIRAAFSHGNARRFHELQARPFKHEGARVPGGCIAGHAFTSPSAFLPRWLARQRQGEQCKARQRQKHD